MDQELDCDAGSERYRWEWDGGLAFTVPLSYEAHTWILFTISVDYARSEDQPRDMSQVTLWGMAPIQWNDVAGTATYLMMVEPGEGFSIDGGSIGYPGGYTRGWEGSRADPPAKWGGTDDENWIKFFEFENSVVKVSVSPNPFTTCVGATIPFTASGALGTFTYKWGGSGEVVSYSGPRKETAYIRFTSRSSNATVTATAGGPSGKAKGIVNDVWIEHVTKATTPANTNRTTIGVGEEVTLTLHPTCSDNISWTLSGAGSLSALSGNPITFTAAGYASSPNITAIQNGILRSISFDVKEPTGYDHAGFISTGDPAYPVNVAGASMYLDVTMAPTSVSFYRVIMGELTNAASSVTGYFTNKNNLAHSTAGHFWQLDEANSWIDHCWTPGCPTPWSDGGFGWIIPWRWYVPGYSTNYMSSWSETFTIDANGTMSISKFGKTVTRTTNDVINPHP